MTEHEASRTLVKSPPELWTECSDASSLARHLGEFGEIKITRLEPETTVAWEGEHASGTVRIESSGWGTRVTLTAQVETDVAEEEPEPVAEEPQPVAEPEPPVQQPANVAWEPPPESARGVERRGFLKRMRALFRGEPIAPLPARREPEPVAAGPEPLVEPAAVAVEPDPEPVLGRAELPPPEPAPA